MDAYEILRAELDQLELDMADALVAGGKPTRAQRTKALRLRIALTQLDLERLIRRGQSQSIAGRAKTEVEVRALRDYLAGLKTELKNVVGGGIRVRQGVPLGV